MTVTVQHMEGAAIIDTFKTGSFEYSPVGIKDANRKHETCRKPHVILNTTGKPPRVPELAKEYKTYLRSGYGITTSPWMPIVDIDLDVTYYVSNPYRLIATEFR